jgi:hypothetical protein
MAANPKKTSGYGRKYRLGVSAEDFSAQLAWQGCLCAICGTTLLLDASTHQDHDHATGRVRAILCRLCNQMLGQARDSQQILRNAAAYLDAYASS